MKLNRVINFWIIIVMIFVINSAILAEQPQFDLTARSAYLMEVETGEVLYEKNPDLELPPASMTKMMTLLLIMESLEKGRANLDDKIIVSEYAASMGGSQVYLEPGEEMTLEQMIKAIAISSANDAAVAVAKYLYGTANDFVDEMNKKAAELDLNHTYFYNAHGLPSESQAIEGNYTSARDLANLARELLEYPDILEWSSTWIDYLRDGEFVLNNTNRMVRHYPGADGFKTGFTVEAKFCVTATAKRNDIRFIAVIMGAPTSNKRFNEAAQLLSYGFNIYDNLEFASRNEIITEVMINNAREEKVEVTAVKDLVIPVRKGQEDKINKEVIIFDKIEAPLNKGDTVGQIKVFKDNFLLKTVDLAVNRDVHKASVLQLMLRMIQQSFQRLMNIFT